MSRYSRRSLRTGRIVQCEDQTNHGGSAQQDEQQPATAIFAEQLFGLANRRGFMGVRLIDPHTETTPQS